MRRVQAHQLFYPQKQENIGREAGDSEILQMVPRAYQAHRNKEITKTRRMAGFCCYADARGAERGAPFDLAASETYSRKKYYGLNYRA